MVFFVCDKFIVSPYLEERVDVDESANKYISYGIGASGEKRGQLEWDTHKMCPKGKKCLLG